MLDFNKIVKILCKKSGKILFKEDIFELIDPEKKPKYQTQVDKLLYRLKSEEKIISIKSGVYVIPTEEDAGLNRVDLIDKYYAALLKKYITYFVGSHYFIAGKKALEIHLRDFSFPETIFVINRSLNKKVCVGNYTIVFKTISGNIGDKKKVNLYVRLSPYVQLKQMDTIELKVANLELAILEALVLHGAYESVDVALITRTLKKYKTVIDTKTLYDIGGYKYIMAFNRLKELAKPVAPDLSAICLDIIKKNGGLFIGEGLRGV